MVYLFGTVTLLTIALRRVVRRQAPLDDEVYLKTVALEHVHSGVAWIRADGTVGSINPSFCSTLLADATAVIGRDWHDLFAPVDRPSLDDGFSQILLQGKANLEVHGRRSDGTFAGVNLLMVAIHDHKMRFVGHHCLIEDTTRERLLERRVDELCKQLKEATNSVPANH